MHTLTDVYNKASGETTVAIDIAHFSFFTWHPVRQLAPMSLINYLRGPQGPRNDRDEDKSESVAYYRICNSLIENRRSGKVTQTMTV